MAHLWQVGKYLKKNGFHAIQEDKPYQLLMKQFKDCKPPSFHNYKEELKKYKGLHIVYSHQCPGVNRFMDEMKDRINELDISITTQFSPYHDKAHLYQKNLTATL